MHILFGFSMATQSSATANSRTAFACCSGAGQSFDEPGLHPEGKFKAADARFTSINEIKVKDLTRWLKKSRDIQWDYKNIVKRKGVLALVEVGECVSRNTLKTFGVVSGRNARQD